MSDPQHRLHKLNHYISGLHHVVRTFPRANPMRISLIQDLAIALMERYHLLGQVDDLEQSILHCTEAIFLPPHLDRRLSNITDNFFLIAQLLLQSTHTQHPEDVKHSVIYLRYLCGRSPGPFNMSPDVVKAQLVCALAQQVKLELGDVTQNIEEMADLCLELLDSDISTTSARIIIHFAEVVKHRHECWGKGKEPPAKVVDCLRKATTRLPDSDELSITLASTLYDRFGITDSNDDYEEGKVVLDKFLTSHAPGDNPSQYRDASLLISKFALARVEVCEKPEYLEEAFYRWRNLVHVIPHEDPSRPSFVSFLDFLQSKRFKFDDFSARDPRELSCHSVISGMSFWELIAPLESPPKGTGLRPVEAECRCLTALLSVCHMPDEVDIEGFIEPCRRLLASSHLSDMSKCQAVSLFGRLLVRAFCSTVNFEYVEEGISILRDHMMSNTMWGFRVAPLLIGLLFIRFTLHRSREDLDEIMQLFQTVVDNRGNRIPDRFKASCDWARFSRSYSHPSTSTAYDDALSLMRDPLMFAPTVEIQNSRLVAMRNNYETLPLDCASYHVQTSQLERAVETLERGRAMIWSEMRGLRSSTDQLRASDSDLADKFAAINQDLEVLTLTFAQNNYGDDGEEVLEGMDPFGRLVLRQRELSDDRDKLISQIRARKGLESFLKPLSFDDLRFAAVLGPVIMINHCGWRSDIIILLYDSPPSLISTADDFYDRANKLHYQLLGARKKGPGSAEYDDALRSVLKELYELVGRPVIQRLNELDVPEQSRLWWCPTAAFCSLPLHAMGPIPSDSDDPRYFLDLYIPSYTPTLSALIESNRSGSHILPKPSLLLVAQQDESMKAALGEMRVVQSVNTQVKTLIAARATPTAVLKCLQNRRFVHIICHGLLEPEKPFDSSFKLYGGKRLTLLDIIRSRLPNAEFAFLAACHTAELTDGSLSDEALHLTAAMQYCGFRSVVGTMWAMADKDGRHLAQNFYNSVFPTGEEQGACYYERTAEALRDAVIDLRGRIANEEWSLERWVNFVHYGA